MQQPPQPPQQPPTPPQPLAHQQLWRWFRQLSRRTQIIGCSVLLFSCILCTGISAIAGKSNQTTPVAVATTAPTQAPTETVPPVMPTAAVTQPIPTTSVATPAPAATPTATPKPTRLVITHGTPHLGGPISDFYGKYGTHIAGDVQAGTAPNGSPEESVGWYTDTNNAYFLAVHYYTPSRIVNYINYSGPSNWSKAQYRDYLLIFAPPGTVENTQANRDWQQSGGDPYDPIAYDSDIGKFFLHISDGVGDMNTV